MLGGMPLPTGSQAYSEAPPCSGHRRHSQLRSRPTKLRVREPQTGTRPLQYMYIVYIYIYISADRILGGHFVCESNEFPGMQIGWDF